MLLLLLLLLFIKFYTQQRNGINDMTNNLKLTISVRGGTYFFWNVYTDTWIVVRFDHDSGICGGHHFFVYPKGGVITFLVSTKGGHVFLWGVLLVATSPPPVEIMNGPLSGKQVCKIVSNYMYFQKQAHRTDTSDVYWLSLRGVYDA